MDLWSKHHKDLMIVLAFLFYSCWLEVVSFLVDLWMVMIYHKDLKLLSYNWSCQLYWLQLVFVCVYEHFWQESHELNRNWAPLFQHKYPCWGFQLSDLHLLSLKLKELVAQQNHLFRFKSDEDAISEAI